LTEPHEIVLRLRPLPDFGLPLPQRLQRAIAALRRSYGLEAGPVDAELPEDLAEAPTSSAGLA
jgi:hypothetical protein